MGPTSVADRAALRDLHIAELKIGTIVYSIADGFFFTLISWSGISPPITPTNFPPNDGAPIAGGLNYRWIASPSP